MKVFDTTLATVMATTAAGLALTLVAPAHAGILITQGDSAPTYSNVLTFDEAGGATGVDVAANAFAAFGVQSIISGSGTNFVGDNSPITGTNTTNSYYGPYGVFMSFGQDLSSASLQAWDSSGPPSGFGGGMAIVLLNDGDENNPVAFEMFNPAYFADAGSWFNITTTGGEVFDEIRVLGFGFFPETYVDNVSWNAVPAPGAFALLGLAGVVVGRRRRN